MVSDPEAGDQFGGALAAGIAGTAEANDGTASCLGAGGS